VIVECGTRRSWSVPVYLLRIRNAPLKPGTWRLLRTHPHTLY